MKYFKRKLALYLTHHLLKMVNDDDILKITTEGYMLKNRKLTPEEVESIRDEAKSINDSELWHFMKTELEWIAFVKGRKSVTAEDNLACHYMFYNLDMIQAFLNRLSK